MRSPLLYLASFVAAFFSAVVACGQCETSLRVSGPTNGRVSAEFHADGVGCTNLWHLWVEDESGAVVDGPIPPTADHGECGLGKAGCDGPQTWFVGCWPEGNYTVKYDSTCNYSTGGGCQHHSPGIKTSEPFRVSRAPIELALSKDLSQPNSVRISYAFGPSSHSLTLTVDGQSVALPQACQTDSGSCTVPLSMSCGTGDHEVVAVASRCSGETTTTRTEQMSPPFRADECKGVQTSCSCSGDGGDESVMAKPAAAPAQTSGPSVCQGEPVHAGSGDVSATIPLFDIGGALPFRFDITYHSALPPNYLLLITRPMEIGWTNTFNMQIHPIAENGKRLILYTSTGESRYFDRDGSVWKASVPATSRNIVVIDANGDYLMKTPGGEETRFDQATGMWKSTTDRWGNSLTAAYDQNMKLVSVSDDFGRTISLTYLGPVIDTVTLTGGATWRLGYLDGRLNKIWDPFRQPPATPWRRIVNDGNGRLVAIKDESDAVLETHAYDIQGRGTSSVVGSGRDAYTFEYDTPQTGQTRVTHTTGGIDTVTVYTLDFVKGYYLPTQLQGVCPSCGTVSETQSFTYDDDGRVLTRTDGMLHQTQYTYDANGNLATITEAAGTAKARTTTYGYGYAPWPTFLTSISQPSVAGAAQKLTTLTWTGPPTSPETVLTTTVSGKSGGQAVSLTTVTTFDALHRVVSVDGPRPVSDVTTQTYYGAADADINRRGRLQQTTNAAGHVTAFDDYDVYATARAIIDANGVTTLRTTDARGRVLTTINKAVAADPNETSDYVSTSTYDGRDRLVETTSPRGTKTRLVYEDGTNWLTETVRLDAAGNEAERRHLTLDAAGRKIAEADQLCSAPAPACASWVTKRSDSFVYDSNGRLSEIDHTIPSGSNVVYTYDADGKPLTVKDENHATANTTYGYDELDRLTAVTQKLGAGTVVTTYGYDGQDNLTAVTDPNGNVTTYVYDDFGRMREQNSPVTGQTTYTYDEAGNLLESKDANTAVTTRTYDLLGRVLTLTAARSGTPSESVTWTYDDPAALHYGIGRLATMTDPTGAPSAAYTYDRRGLLRSEVKRIESSASFGYDANGNRISFTYPSGRIVAYGYDFADRPLSASSGATPIVSGATYLPFGPMTSLTYGNGTTKTTTYDARYRPTENKLTGPAGLIADYLYATDAAGNITQIHDALSPVYDRDFGYDDLNRLTSATTGSSLWGSGAYSYDAMGNMLSLTLGTSRSATFAYAGTTPKLTSVTEDGSARAVSYDAAGNEAHAGGATYLYSNRNHLSAGEGVTYRYDGRGVRTITSDAKLALAIDPSQVIGSNPSTGTVTLTEPAPPGGATVTLASGDPTRVTVPASITIAAGQTTGTFTATTFAVPTTASVAITAAWSGVTATATLTLTPGVWDVASLTLDPTDVLGIRQRGFFIGQTTGTVTLTGAAPAGGIRVSIACPGADCPSAVTVPASATSQSFVAEGSTTEPCGIIDTDCPTTYQVDASFITTKSATFTVHSKDFGTVGLQAGREPFIASVEVTPRRLTGGRRATVTIELAADAPAEGVSIEMLSGDPAAFQLPPRVFIAHGQRSIAFDAATGEVEAETIVRITATANGISRETTVTLEPPRRPLTLAFGAQFVTPHTSSGELRRHSLYTPELNLLAEMDLGLSPTLAYEYVWFAGHPVAQFDLATTTVHWTFTDHLGTPILQTDATAAVDWRAEYEPFGRVHAFRTGASRHQPLRLPGQEYDERTPERHYNIFRWYRDGWGRYTQGDPVGLNGRATSLYDYSLDNPLLYTDRTGLQVLYDPGPTPNGAVRKGCTAGPWRNVPTDPFVLGQQRLWQKTGEEVIQAASSGTPNSAGDKALAGNASPGQPGRTTFNTGWCRCDYQVVGVTTYYGASELWERSVSCCGESATERTTTRNRFWSNTQPAIGGTKSVFAPYNPLERACACAPFL
ncbi:MAG TPA: RHS repeat-associated core domain-containing protein [Thermoanaerobaculia bacterium]|nr:RHS repeat-associated core domain-containing protein [Thermoanaerobaculia bacterium]